MAKGGKRIGAGRVAGGKNLRTLQWEQLGDALLSKHSERANRILVNCDDDVFMDNYGKLLEYFKPKQARQDITVSGDMTVTFIEEDGSGKRSD